MAQFLMGASNHRFDVVQPELVSSTCLFPPEGPEHVSSNLVELQLLRGVVLFILPSILPILFASVNVGLRKSSLRYAITSLSWRPLLLTASSWPQTSRSCPNLNLNLSQSPTVHSCRWVSSGSDFRLSSFWFCWLVSSLGYFFWKPTRGTLLGCLQALWRR